MGRTAIVALLVVVAGAGFWVGRSTGATTTKTEATPSPVVTQAATDRIPILCDDTMRSALATWQQMSDAPFAKEVKAYQASRSGSSERGAARQEEGRTLADRRSMPQAVVAPAARRRPVMEYVGSYLGVGPRP